MPEIKDYVDLTTKVYEGETITLMVRVETGGKIWWIHPDSLSAGLELDQGQIERIEKNGDGPFVLISVETNEEGIFLYFKNGHGELVKEKAKYFTV